MRNFSKFEGKLIRMNKSYPIHNDDDEIVGYTKVGDMAVITFAEIKKKTLVEEKFSHWFWFLSGRIGGKWWEILVNLKAN